MSVNAKRKGESVVIGIKRILRICRRPKQLLAPAPAYPPRARGDCNALKWQKAEQRTLRAKDEAFHCA